MLLKPFVEKDHFKNISNLSQTNTFIKYKENELLEKQNEKNTSLSFYYEIQDIQLLYQIALQVFNPQCLCSL